MSYCTLRKNENKAFEVYILTSAAFVMTKNVELSFSLISNKGKIISFEEASLQIFIFLEKFDTFKLVGLNRLQKYCLSGTL